MRFLHIQQLFRMFALIKLLMICRNRKIDYSYYNSLANSFKQQYGVDTSSNLTVYLKVNKKTDEPYTVEFYATIEKSDFHLFDFIFNGTDGVLIGELTTDDGSAVKVNVNSYELEIDKLSEDEISNLYLMQEDINYILQKLIAEDNFQEVTN